MPLDTTTAEYGSGWHYCATLAAALQVAGLWPDGWPVVVLRIEASKDALPRGRKYRASQLTIMRRADDTEIAEAIHALSAGFGRHQDQMAVEQLAWREALGRPRHDPVAVERCLREALEARGLAAWRLQPFDTARDAWAAWAARAAGAAWAAWAALVVTYASLMSWVPRAPDRLTRGLREAYAGGLALAIPVAPGILGYALVERMHSPGTPVS